MNDNLFRRVNWLWKHRHTHDGDIDVITNQIQIIRADVEGQADDISIGAPAGQAIHVAAQESIPDGTPTAVTFSMVFAATTEGFTQTLNAIPTTDLVAPSSAVSQATVRVAWDDITAGGWHGDGVRAALKVNGSTIDEWEADDPALVPIAPLQADSVKLPVEAGDILTLELTQDSGVARNATVSVSWGIEDPKGGAVINPDMVLHAKVWEDETSEPDWQVTATDSLVVGSLYPGLIFGLGASLSDDTIRQCDWMGWGPTGSAPVVGEAGFFTDFCEAHHTVGQPPVGWTQVLGTDRIEVETLIASNSPCGRAAVSANWVTSAGQPAASAWTEHSAASGSAHEVTAALRTSSSGRNPPAVGVFTLNGAGWLVSPSTTDNQLVITRREADGTLTPLELASPTLAHSTWYRVRFRLTPGG